MSNIIILIILFIALFVGIRESIKHFKGQGSCCGGGTVAKPKRKKLIGPAKCKYVVKIEGMHCENCSNRVESKLNALDGVACRVKLRKKEAVLRAACEVEEEKIIEIISGLGYEVKKIKAYL